MEVLTIIIIYLILCIIGGFIMLVICINTGIFPVPPKDRFAYKYLYWRKNNE